MLKGCMILYKMGNKCKIWMADCSQLIIQDLFSFDYLLLSYKYFKALFSVFRWINPCENMYFVCYLCLTIQSKYAWSIFWNSKGRLKRKPLFTAQMWTKHVIVKSYDSLSKIAHSVKLRVLARLVYKYMLALSDCVATPVL
jgi:hypothetical protein